MTPKVVSARATSGKLTRYGKRCVALAMYQKGKAFVASALLIKRQARTEATEYVFLHLLCQGIEVLLKGLLLLRNYDKHFGRLAKPIGHNLSRVATEVLAAYRLKPMRSDLAAELAEVNKLYGKHLLRYGSLVNIFIDPASVRRELVAHRVYAAIRLTERELRREKSLI